MSDENNIQDSVETPSDEDTASSEKSEDVDPDKERIAALEAENAEIRGQMLRIRADAENYRKRMVRQQQDERKYQNQDILRDLSDVVDNFERAIQSSEESQDYDVFHEGIVMIEKQFSGMLRERYGLERMGAPGESFDPSAHEAVMLEESEDVEHDTVAQVLQSGYRLWDRVLRPAKVKVVKPLSTKETTDNDDDKETKE